MFCDVYKNPTELAFIKMYEHVFELGRLKMRQAAI